MPGRIYTIYTQFDQKFMPGRIWNSTGHEILLKMGVNSLGLHLYASLIELGIIPMNSTGFTPNLSSISCPVEFDRARNTAQNGSKFTGITFVCLPDQIGSKSMNFNPNWAVFHARSNSTGQEILLKMGVNSLGLIVCLPGRIGYHSNEFTPILSSISCLVEFQIRPGKKYCSIWVEIHGFTPNSTGHEILLKLGWNSWIYSQFDRGWNTAQIGLKFMDLLPIRPGINYWSNWVEIHWDYTIV